MLMRDANRLASEWGNKPCTHPQFEKEFVDFDGGTPTGDHVCVQCGRACESLNSPSERKAS